MVERLDQLAPLRMGYRLSGLEFVLVFHLRRGLVASNCDLGCLVLGSHCLWVECIHRPCMVVGWQWLGVGFGLLVSHMVVGLEGG